MKKQRKKMPRGAKKQARMGQTGPGQKPIALRGGKDNMGNAFVVLQLGTESGVIPIETAEQLYEGFGKILDELKELP